MAPDYDLQDIPLQNIPLVHECGNTYSFISFLWKRERERKTRLTYKTPAAHRFIQHTIFITNSPPPPSPKNTPHNNKTKTNKTPPNEKHDQICCAWFSKHIHGHLQLNFSSAVQNEISFALLTCTQPTYPSPIYNDLGVL